MASFSLSDLAGIISERAKSGDPASSYTAKLISRGIGHCAKKFR